MIIVATCKPRTPPVDALIINDNHLVLDRVKSVSLPGVNG